MLEEFVAIALKTLSDEVTDISSEILTQLPEVNAFIFTEVEV